MTTRFAARAARALRKPPRVVVRRLTEQAWAKLERVAAPRRAARLTEQVLLRRLEASSTDFFLSPFSIIVLSQVT